MAKVIPGFPVQLSLQLTVEELAKQYLIAAVLAQAKAGSIGQPLQIDISALIADTATQTQAFATDNQQPVTNPITGAVVNPNAIVS